VEKVGLRERKLSAVFSILLIFGGLFKAWKYEANIPPEMSVDLR
jgi:hypothetical protein